MPAPLTIAFEWPSAPAAQLVVSIRHRTDPTPQSLGPPCTFGGKWAQMGLHRQSKKACQPELFDDAEQLRVPDWLSEPVAGAMRPRPHPDSHTPQSERF